MANSATWSTAELCCHDSKSLAGESARMQNAPVFAANSILAHLQAMEQRINARFDRVDAKFNQVDAKLLAR
jgi:hypothetical protein